MTEVESYYRGRRILVLGLAGSGVAALRLLGEHGAEIKGADENGDVEIPSGMDRVDISLGVFSRDLLDGCDEIVLSPGIAGDHPFKREAEMMGIPVISELELGFRFARASIIAVTGTNGKSTTVSMIGEILKEEGYDAVVAGNIGTPFCSVVDGLGPGGFFVLEVSSFQLETISSFHPAIAGILNLTPDHLDRYGSDDDYYRAKARIVENMDENDSFFFNAEDRRCSEIAEAFRGLSVPFSSRGPVQGGVYLDGQRMVRERDGLAETFMESSLLSVVGLHNVENALAAVASLKSLTVSAQSCRRALSRFRGLPHRMEEVATIDGVTYYNDSKATNVEATVMTLRGLDRPVILIAGGYDKGGDYSKLLPALEHVKKLITIGAAAPLIEKAVGSLVPVIRAVDMKEAVELAGRSAMSGQIVILSPACASFDMYRNFEHRGEVFKRCVTEFLDVDR